MASYNNGHSNGATAYTLTALKRWSILDRQLPSVDKIKSIHVYDFDNTLFNSPLPNSKIWTGPTIGFLQSQDTLANGGWWHDSRILASTGEGLDKEEAKAWEGWWNEKIVELVQLSMQQKDALTVLLTGRSESGFSELVQRMVASKGMEFDLMGLKPAVGPNNQKFSRTMRFKQEFLTCLVETYKKADEIRIYEDRPKHTKEFREFLTDYNKRQIGGHPTRGPITAEVVQVADGATVLDPVQEVAQVQRIINDHNAAASTSTSRNLNQRLQIKKTVFYTGYLISETDSQRLLTLAQLPPNMPDSELKIHANNILITPRPCNNSILEKVGGMGNKVTWEVTGTAVYENRIWAALVRPSPNNQDIYTDNPVPIVVLALRKGARPFDASKIQNWQPVPPEKAFIFDSTVGEKVTLRIEHEDPDETEYESLFPTKVQKRKHVQDDETSIRHSENLGHQGRGRGGGYQQNNNGYGGNGRGGGGRGGRGGNNQRGRGGGRGNGGGGRGKGRGGFNYRSLDDVGEKPTASQTGYNVAVAYEDFPPLQKQYQTPQQLVQQQFQQYQQYQQQMQSKGGQQGWSGELQYS